MAATNLMRQYVLSPTPQSWVALALAWIGYCSYLGYLASSLAEQQVDPMFNQLRAWMCYGAAAVAFVAGACFLSGRRTLAVAGMLSIIALAAITVLLLVARSADIETGTWGAVFLVALTGFQSVVLFLAWLVPKSQVHD
jgi:hypothetical protein